MAMLPRQRSFTRFGGAFHEHQVRLSRKGKTNVDLQSVMEKWERLRGWDVGRNAIIEVHTNNMNTSRDDVG